MVGPGLDFAGTSGLVRKRVRAVVRKMQKACNKQICLLQCDRLRLQFSIPYQPRVRVVAVTNHNVVACYSFMFDPRL